MDKRELSVGISEGLFEEVLATAYSPTVTLSELIKNSSDACYINKDTIKINVDTASNVITVKDNGTGLSKSDIKELTSVGKSQKMSQGNFLSRLGEPYAGSKGLGLLTAFNLCESLEVLTYSTEDKKTYHLHWQKGTRKIVYKEQEQPSYGTLLTMTGVSNESISMITREDEIDKLLLSSINYYISSETLPTFQLFINGILKNKYHDKTLEEIYQKYKRPRTKSEHESLFVSKGTFKYFNNKLELSHEDNLFNVCCFENERIDLANLDSVRSFLSRNNIVFKNFEARLGNFDPETKVDDFEGVYYVWRGRKRDDLSPYPYGLRIYVNNYGLYNYLGKSNDWTEHSQISQNISSTNYKLQNTYGYVAFNNFNEDNSGLKISKERNDFTGNLARKKFYHIMRGFVSGIFSAIDISLKKTKGDGSAFVQVQQNRRTCLNKPIDIRDLVRSDLPIKQLIFSHNNNLEIDRDKGIIHVKALGDHKLTVSNGKTELEVLIKGEDPTPNFELPTKPTKVKEGNTKNLLDIVNSKSLVNVDLADIITESDNAEIDQGTLKATNKPGFYQIYYTYRSDGHPDICKVHDIIVTPLFEKQAAKIKRLFPDYEQLDDYHKLNDVVGEISTGYVNSPVICGIALRSLVEITMRHFIEDVLNEEPEKEINTQAKMHHIFNLLNNEDSRLDQSVVKEYRNKLCRNRKQLTKYYEELGLNNYVHDVESIITSNEILAFSRRLKNFLDFLFKSLIIKTQQ